MVKVIGFKTRTSKTGEDFLVLELQGGITPVQSKQTNRMYFTAKKCTAPCTFDEATAKELIGMQFPGEIVRVECDEYDYTIPETGEIVTLEHRWEYQDASIGILQENVIEEEAVM